MIAGSSSRGRASSTGEPSRKSAGMDAAGEQRAALGRYGGSGFDAGAQLRISARKSGREIRKRRFIDQKTRFKFAAHFGERRGGFAGMERDRQCSHPYRTEPGDEIDRARQTEQRDRHSRLGAERAETGRRPVAIEPRARRRSDASPSRRQLHGRRTSAMPARTRWEW
jgi:hypothetical protein